MREKLLLLSRIPISPPNPRVSGGLPLLHGGSLHRHGGSPLPHGGLFPPHRLGIVAVSRCLVNLRPQPSTQTPKFLSPLSTSQPPFTLLTHLPPDALHYRRRFPRSDLLLQTLRAAVMYPLTTLSAPIDNSAPLVLLGTRSKAGALFRSSWTTASPAPPRPPAKPPPRKRHSYLVSLFVQKLFVLSLVLSPSLSVVPIRPPPKPPWPKREFIASQIWVFAYGLPMGYWFQILGCCSSWINYAHQVFVENPHRAFGCLSTRLWILLLYMVSVKTFGDDTFADDNTNFQFALKSHDKWFNLETIFSRIERTQVKDIIRNWIGKKTVESLSLISTSTWELKPLVFWLFRCCVRVAYGLMDLYHFKCIGLNAHSSCVVVFIIVVVSSVWYGNVQPNLLHVILLMVLSSLE